MGSIGDLLMKTGKYQQAVEAYERALERMKGIRGCGPPLAMPGRRQVHMTRQRLPTFGRWNSIRQGHIWINKAKALTMLGRHEDAIHACSRQSLSMIRTLMHGCTRDSS